MTQFRYFRMHGGRRATAAIKVEREGDTTYIHAGVSYRNPRDKYIKGYGEAKASGRLRQLMMNDGFNLVRTNPDKYVALTITGQEHEEVVKQFDDLLYMIVNGFKPAAVMKQEQEHISKGNG